MPTLATSPRALTAALIPLLGLHILAVAMIAVAGADPRFSTPDAILVALLARLTFEAALLVGLHILARWHGVTSRSAYAAIGAIVGVAGYGVAIASGFWPRLASDGAVVTTGLAPAAAGLLAGIIYHQVAGFRWGAAQPHSSAPGAPEGSSARPAAFAGPLQVRTSAAAFLLISLAPAIVCGVFMFAAMFGSIAGFQPYAPRPPKGSHVLLGVAAPIFLVLAGIPFTALPAAMFIWAGHAIARAMNRIDHRSYALIGAGLAAGVPFLLSGGRIGMAALVFTPLGAGMMALYRRIAGLEPKPLPEHVLVQNPEALVAASHPARHEHRVVYGR